MTAIISHDTIIKTIDPELSKHPLLQPIEEGSYVTRDGSDIHLVEKTWSNKIEVGEPNFANFTCVKESDYGWVNAGDVHENYLHRYLVVDYKPTPVVMRATPRLHHKSILTIHKTAGGTYRILFDGQVHPLFVGYASIEEAQAVEIDRLNVLIAMAQLATRTAVKSSFKFTLTFLPINQLVIAAGTSKEAWDKLFHSTDEERAREVLGTKYLDSSVQYARGETPVIQHVDDAAFLPCEGRNALPGE